MRSTPMSVIKGKYITIEELPIGCVVTDSITNSSVVIGDLKDVDLLIENLQKLKSAGYVENIGDLKDIDLLIESLQKLKSAWYGENNE